MALKLTKVYLIGVNWGKRYTFSQKNCLTFADLSWGCRTFSCSHVVDCSQAALKDKELRQNVDTDKTERRCPRKFQLLEQPRAFGLGTQLLHMKDVFLAHYFMHSHRFHYQYDENFIKQSTRVIVVVSQLISIGNFQELAGLVTNETIEEVEESWGKLDEEERQMIAVSVDHVIKNSLNGFKFTFLSSGATFAEVTMLLVSYPRKGQETQQKEKPSEGLWKTVQEYNKSESYVYSVYTFKKEVTADLPHSNLWTITKLNHYTKE